jgi:hypothetical protein
MKLLNSKLLIIVGILISFIRVECAQKIIKVSNIEISFENKGQYTEFNLKSSLSGQLQNVWMGVGLGPGTRMVSIFYFCRAYCGKSAFKNLRLFCIKKN